MSSIHHEWRSQPMPANSKSTSAWRVSYYAPGSDTPQTVMVVDVGETSASQEITDSAAMLANTAYGIGVQRETGE